MHVPHPCICVSILRDKSGLFASNVLDLLMFFRLPQSAGANDEKNNLGQNDNEYLQ